MEHRTVEARRGVNRQTSLPTIRQPVLLGPEVASHVRELILTGQLRAGDSIVIDRLARELAVSSTPVREALVALNGEGFLDFEARRGFRVSRLTPQDVADVYWLQAVLAGELAARATERLDSEAIGRLIEIQGQMRHERMAGSADEIEGLNHEFHRTINCAAASTKLTWMLAIAVRYAPRRYYSIITGWIDASLNDHDTVIDAFKEKDPEKARQTMQRHITHAGTLLVQNLAAQGFWPDEVVAIDPGTSPNSDRALSAKIR